MMTESEVRAVYLMLRAQLAMLELGAQPDGLTGSRDEARIWLTAQRTALGVVLGERLDPATGEPIEGAV